MRLLVVWTLIVANIRQTKGNLFNQYTAYYDSGLLHQQANSTGGILRRVYEDLQQRPSGRIDDFVDITRDEQQDNEEDRAGEGADADAGYHDLGTFSGCLGDLCVD